jgi:hypothetical protein
MYSIITIYCDFVQNSTFSVLYNNYYVKLYDFSGVKDGGGVLKIRKPGEKGGGV